MSNYITTVELGMNAATTTSRPYGTSVCNHCKRLREYDDVLVSVVRVGTTEKQLFAVECPECGRARINMRLDKPRGKESSVPQRGYAD